MLAGRGFSTVCLQSKPVFVGLEINEASRCKKFQETTEDDRDGYPVYRRRPGRSYLHKGKYHVDSRWVVPYNRALLWKYNAHMNVEVCSTLHAVKYLHKYIHKGGDRAEVRIAADYAAAETETFDAHEQQPLPKPPVDEISDYIEGRYISTSEAVWHPCILLSDHFGKFASVLYADVFRHFGASEQTKL